MPKIIPEVSRKRAPKSVGDNREVTPLDDFLAAFNLAIEDGRFSSLVLSKNLRAADDLRSVRVRRIGLRGEPALSFVYHHKARDETRNLDLAAGPVAVATL